VEIEMARRGECIDGVESEEMSYTDDRRLCTISALRQTPSQNTF
jgi:hypothetical protein